MWAVKIRAYQCIPREKHRIHHEVIQQLTLHIIPILHKRLEIGNSRCAKHCLILQSALACNQQAWHQKKNVISWKDGRFDDQFRQSPKFSVLGNCLSLLADQIS